MKENKGCSPVRPALPGSRPGWRPVGSAGWPALAGRGRAGGWPLRLGGRPCVAEAGSEAGLEAGLTGGRAGGRPVWRRLRLHLLVPFSASMRTPWMASTLGLPRRLPWRPYSLCDT